MNHLYHKCSILEEKNNHALLVLVPQMDEEGQKVGPTKPTASLMLSKDQQCMESVKFWRKQSVKLGQKLYGSVNMGFVMLNINVYYMLN